MRPLDFSPAPESWDAYEVIHLIGARGAIETALESPALQPGAAVITTALPLLKEAARRSDTLTLPLEGKRLQLTVLATARGRMSCPARSDLIQKSAEGSARRDCATLILIALEEHEHGAAAASAVARAYSAYQGRSGRSIEQRSAPLTLSLLGPDGPLSLSELEPIAPRLHAIRQAASWVDQPPNEFNVSHFIEAAREVASRWSQAGEVEIDVIRGEEAARAGLGGIWGVGQAAQDPPALVVLQGPKSSATAPQTVWVGKGIVYDTGGLSLKGKTAMPGMKSDMGGAAAALAAFDAACALGLQRDLSVILCLAENAIGPAALRPDDIITLYSGKRVEINNTDAEGRLVLGDGVAWATRHLNPELIIDLATLTGAQLVSTGRLHAAVVSNDEALEGAAVQAGRQSGDLVHPLPYVPELLIQEFKSKVADLRNSVADRMNAQSSCAAHFVEAHLGENYTGRWLHVDLAGPAFARGRGTGFGVGLLLELLERERSA